jgi:predicted transcriptional regulator
MEEVLSMSEDSLFLELFGKSPVFRVLDFFLDNPMYDYSRKEVMENLRISRNVLFKISRILEKVDVIKPTRKVEMAQLYPLNTESELTEKLLELDQALAKRFIPMEAVAKA